MGLFMHPDWIDTWERVKGGVENDSTSAGFTCVAEMDL